MTCCSLQMLPWHNWNKMLQDVLLCAIQLYSICADNSNSVVLIIFPSQHSLLCFISYINHCIQISGNCGTCTVHIPTQETQYLSAIVEILKEQLVLTASDGDQLILQVLLSVRPYKEDFTFISPVSENIFINLAQHMYFLQ